MGGVSGGCRGQGRCWGRCRWRGCPRAAFASWFAAGERGGNANRAHGAPVGLGTRGSLCAVRPPSPLGSLNEGPAFSPTPPPITSRCPKWCQAPPGSRVGGSWCPSVPSLPVFFFGLSCLGPILARQEDAPRRGAPFMPPKAGQGVARGEPHGEVRTWLTSRRPRQGSWWATPACTKLWPCSPWRTSSSA